MDRKVRWTLLLATVVVAVSAVVLTPLAGAASTAKICGNVSAHWSFSGHSGTLYIVDTTGGASCSFAVQWAPKLIKERPADALRSGGGPIGGPAGWTCHALVQGQSSMGACFQKGHGKVVFAWTPKIA
jgi:hypothetical protein